MIEQLRAARRQLLQRHGGIAGLASFLRQEETKPGERVVEPTRDAGAKKVS